MAAGETATFFGAFRLVAAVLAGRFFALAVVFREVTLRAGFRVAGRFAPAVFLAIRASMNLSQGERQRVSFLAFQG